ncbi:MAG: DUF3368 domain-containing protein [Pirellulales bacterium]
MIVVSDTTPLNYFVLIGQQHTLPDLFGRVVTSPAVIVELTRPKTPPAVKTWASAPPAWLEVKAPTATLRDSRLGPGEAEAIALALELNADILLIDDRDGVAAAQKLGILITGTLGVIEMAAERGLLSLPDAIAALRQTTFRGPEELINELLRHDQERRSKRKRRKRRDSEQ